MQDVATARSTKNRVAWQCRRGMRELDELLHNFLHKRFAELNLQQQVTFDTLLEYPDAVLLELLMGRMTPADREVEYLVQEIRNTAAA